MGSSSSVDYHKLDNATLQMLLSEMDTRKHKGDFFRFLASAVEGVRIIHDLDRTADAKAVLGNICRRDSELLQEWNQLLHFHKEHGEIWFCQIRVTLMVEWVRCDRNANGFLSKKELRALVNAVKMQESLRKELCEKLGQISEKRKRKSSSPSQRKGKGNDRLTFGHLDKAYMRLVGWDEVWEYVSPFASSKEDPVTVNGLVNFMHDVQGEQTFTQQDAISILGHFGGCISWNSFMVHYLSDPDLNAPTRHSMMDYIYQDMNQPLNHYYINSSHNTYPSENQLTSEGPTELYVKALRKGVRYVEIDAWDGKHGDPIVYHSHTLTSKLSFKSVIEAINEHAFDASKYPVIISIENHCGIKQQNKMAGIMKKTFGFKLQMPIVEPDQKPTADQIARSTPQNMKGKIILKAHRLSKEEGPDEVSQELSDITWMQATSSSASPESFNIVDVFSKSEGTIHEDIEKKPDWVKMMTSKGFVRGYPAGIQLESRNEDPQPPWNHGVQLMAQNYQTEESYQLQLNKGFFKLNGNCGWRLKPSLLRHFNLPSHDSFPASCTLSVRVLSGFALPKPKNRTKGEVVDPYANVFVEGIDCGDGGKTSAVRNNGFHPVWSRDGPIKLDVPVPEVSTLVIRIFDKDLGKDDPLGQCFIPISALKQGVRSVPMRWTDGRTLCSTFLMLYITITPKAR